MTCNGDPELLERNKVHLWSVTGHPVTGQCQVDRFFVFLKAEKSLGFELVLTVMETMNLRPENCT